MWETNAVKDSQSMITGATSFDANLSTWNVQSLESTNAMFNQANSFNPDLCGCNVTKLTYAIRMFATAIGFHHTLCACGDRLLDNSDVQNIFDRATSCARDFIMLLLHWSRQLPDCNANPLPHAPTL
jgi:hypothetical protein